MDALPAPPINGGQADTQRNDCRDDNPDKEISIAQIHVASPSGNSKAAAVPETQEASAAVKESCEQLVPMMPFPQKDDRLEEMQPPETLKVPPEHASIPSAPATDAPGDADGVLAYAGPALIHPAQVEKVIEVAEVPPPEPSLIEDIPLAPVSLPLQGPAPKMKKQDALAEPVAKRPVRQSKLRHRNFDLEVDSEEDEFEEKPRRGRGARKKVQLSEQMHIAASGSYGYQSEMERTHAAPYMESSLEVPGTPQAASFSIIDLPCPRRLRSKIETRPRTSRASINRLKKAAHGILPLGESSTAALLGSPGVSAGNSDGEATREYDSGGSRRGYKRRKQASEDTWASQQRQKASDGPNALQRHLMTQIATAPPHMRQAMLQELMKQQLGVPAPNNASLASLPRSEQQAVVQQLMGRMSPQQRHLLLQMSTQQQAAFLQQYYQEHVLPQQRLPVPVAAPIPSPAPQIHQQQFQQPQQQQQQQQAGVAPAQAANSQQHLQSILAKLSPQQHAQLMALPKEQQHGLVMRLLQQRINTPPAVPMQSSLPTHQPDLTGLGGRGGDAANFLLPTSQAGPPTGVAGQLGPGPGTWGAGALNPPSNNDDLALLGQPAAPSLVGGVRKDSCELGDTGLGALIANGPRGDDLQDAMNYFLS